MSDAFAVLGLPRRPLLDPEDIKNAHHRLAASGPASAELNEARSILENPATRLRLLADGEPPANVADWEFLMRCGAVFKNADRWLQASRSASSALQRAVLRSELPGIRRDLDSLAAALQARQDELQTRLAAADARWPDVESRELAALAGEFVFLQRQTDLAAKTRLDLEIAGS